MTLTTTSPTSDHLLAENARLLSQVEKLGQMLAKANEQLEWFKRQIFGQKAERVIDTQNSEQLCFEGFDKLAPVLPEEKKLIPAHERKQRPKDGQDKITFPADLPIERQVLDIPEEDKVCPETGKALVKIGEEVTSKIAHKPASFFIKQIVRPKYALPEKSGGGVLTAEFGLCLTIHKSFISSFLISGKPIDKRI